MVVDFTLEEASEVTAFVGQYDTDTRWVTFMQRTPLGSGTHRVTWNGTNSKGQIAHPPS
jgi:flagellar hook assembly protein FlgD